MEDRVKWNVWVNPKRNDKGEIVDADWSFPDIWSDNVRVNDGVLVVHFGGYYGENGFAAFPVTGCEAVICKLVPEAEQTAIRDAIDRNDGAL